MEKKETGLRVYGRSDDLIVFDGDYTGEVCSYDAPVLLLFSDHTMIEASYGVNFLGIWKLNVMRRGSAFLEHVACLDEDAEIYSDIVRFAPGIKWVVAAKQWEYVK